MYHVYQGVVSNSLLAHPYLQSHLDICSDIYNRLIHRLCTDMIKNKVYPERSETFALISHVFPLHERARKRFMCDINTLRSICSLAYQKFQLILAGDELYHHEKIYRISCIPFDRFVASCGTILTGYESLTLKGGACRLEIQFKSQPKGQAVRGYLKKAPLSENEWRFFIFTTEKKSRKGKESKR